jgi:hypothetical protein
LFEKRITKLICNNAKRDNNRFTFTYLKECYTVLISRFSDVKYIPKCRVSVDLNGLPRIIPVNLRKKLDDRRIYVFVATILCIHRVIKWFPDVSLNTIIDRFDGISTTFSASEIKRSLANLKNISLTPMSYPRLGKLKMEALSSESAGPNSNYANSGVILDAIALIKYPSALLNLIRLYSFYKGGYKFIICLVVIILST